jgi:hypothetical protein
MELSRNLSEVREAGRRWRRTELAFRPWQLARLGCVEGTVNTANVEFWFGFGSTYSYLSAARIACLAKATFEPWLPEFARAVFRANFAEDREIGDAAEIRSILDSLVEPGAQLIDRAQAPENKLRLREQTRRPKGSGSSAPRASLSAQSSSGETTVWRTPWRGQAHGRLNYGGERCFPRN